MKLSDRVVMLVDCERELNKIAEQQALFQSKIVGKESLLLRSSIVHLNRSLKDDKLFCN